MLSLLFNKFCETGHIDLFTCDSDIPEGHKCKYCDFRTNLRIVLNKHVQNVHKDKPFKHKMQSYSCQECTLRTNSLLVITKHSHQQCKSKKSPEIVFECEHCSHKSKSTSALKKHHRLKHLNKELECDQYPLPLIDDPLSKPIGYLDCDNVRWYQCEQCPHRTKRFHDLKRHTLQHSVTISPITTPQSAPTKRFQCEQCAYETKRKGDLNKHIQSKHTNRSLSHDDTTKWFPCALCSYRTKRSHDLQKHTIAKHMDQEIKREMIKKLPHFRCEECSYATPRKTDLKKHVLVRHVLKESLKKSDKKWFVCEQCSYESRRRHDLKKHVLAVHVQV